jgi:hypothetical protein
MMGAGVMLGYARKSLADQPAGSVGELFEPTIWYGIDRSGTVTVHIVRAELGQHVGTALARIVADELEADWSKVKTVLVDTDPKWGLMLTGGSLSVWQSFPILSRAGAAGRVALIEEGAKLLIEHGAPKLTDYGKMLWSGRRFLILGPTRSGKSNFLDFLEHLLLQPEKLTSITVRVVKREDKILRLGPDRSLTLRVRKPRDVPGQDPIYQIEYVKDYTPHCIVNVLDATKFFGVPAKDSALDWLRQFATLLNPLLTSNKKVANKLKSMTVVMNKWDKIAEAAKKDAEAAKKSGNDDKEYREIYELYVRDVLNDSLHCEFYSKDGATNIDIVPCVLVSHTSFGDSLARQLIQSIALSLSRR